MSFYLGKTVPGEFAAVEARTREALKKQGFGVITEIDMKATLKQKIDADIHPYKILGACNPRFAHKALGLEDKVGVFLPCNVVLQERQSGEIEISVIDPQAMILPMGPRPDLKPLVEEASTLLNNALREI